MKSSYPSPLKSCGGYCKIHPNHALLYYCSLLSSRAETIPLLILFVFLFLPPTPPHPKKENGNNFLKQVQDYSILLNWNKFVNDFSLSPTLILIVTGFGCSTWWQRWCKWWNCGRFSRKPCGQVQDRRMVSCRAHPRWYLVVTSMIHVS